MASKFTVPQLARKESVLGHTNDDCWIQGAAALAEARAARTAADAAAGAGAGYNAELIAKLAEWDPAEQPCLIVAARSAAGDQGGGVFVRSPSGAGAIDNRVRFASANPSWHALRDLSGKVLDARQAGLSCDGSTDDTAALAAFVSAVGSMPLTLQVSAETKISGTVTLPDTIAVRFEHGGVFSGNGTVTHKPWMAQQGWGNPGNIEIYVSPDGNDAFRSGLGGWADAKRTLIDAYLAAPAGGGTIHVADGAWMGGYLQGQGLWACGTADPNFTSAGYPGYAGADKTSSGWLRKKPVRIVGHGIPIDWGQHKPTAAIIGGTPSSPGYTLDADNPALWICTGDAIGGYIEGIEFSTAYRAACLGVPTTKDRTPAGAGSIQGWTFDSCRFYIPVPGEVGPPVAAGMGPAVEILGGWKILFEGCSFNGIGPYLADSTGYPGHSLTAEQRAASIAIKGGADVAFKRCVTWWGNIDYTCYDTGQALRVYYHIHEADFIHPADGAVHIHDSRGSDWNRSAIEDVLLADVPDAEPALVVEPVSADPSAVQVRHCTATGPCTPTVIAPPTPNDSPIRAGQVGFWHDRIAARYDGVIRSCPVVARFDNLITVAPASGGSTTVTPAQSDPWGTTSAYLIESASGVIDIPLLDKVQTVAVGDFFAYAVLVRFPSGAYDSSVACVASLGTGNVFAGVTTKGVPLIEDADGQWWLLQGGGVVTDAGTPSGEIRFIARFNDTHPVIVCCPTVHYEAAGTVSEHEWYEFMLHMPVLPLGAEAGIVYQPGEATVDAPSLSAGEISTPHNAKIGEDGMPPIVSPTLQLGATTDDLLLALATTGRIRLSLPEDDAGCVSLGLPSISTAVDGDLWTLDEASGNITGKINSRVIATQGTPLYQQTMSQLRVSRYGINPNNAGWFEDATKSELDIGANDFSAAMVLYTPYIGASTFGTMMAKWNGGASKGWLLYTVVSGADNQLCIRVGSTALILGILPLDTSIHVLTLDGDRSGVATCRLDHETPMTANISGEGADQSDTGTGFTLFALPTGLSKASNWSCWAWYCVGARVGETAHNNLCAIVGA